ncbi:META domain-containing protein [Zavarzinella formosa]|uniref:hypothetical protein n=1 Tax=Zavarzinella formosa TaxID=360055 RepID=UPI0012F71F9F|nr:hypothetical protein [Zavarzinella formosa]
MKLANIARLGVVAIVLVMAGCSTNKGKIEGTKWTSNATTIQGKTVPAGALTLSFGADGKLVYTGGQTIWTGKYSLGMGDYVTFNTDQDLGGHKSNAERISINGNVLTMKDSDGTSITFTKVN